MKHDSRFWDRIAEKYARRPIADEDIYQEKLRITRDLLDPDAEAVEFGCGTGSTAIAHAPHAKRILATDFSEKMLEIAREKARAAGIGNVEFRRTGIEELDVPDASADVVLGMSVLHLLKDKEAAIAKAFRMLRPGGAFVSSTACLGDMSFLIRAILPLGRAVGAFPTVKSFTADALARSLTDAGFEIERNWRPGRNKAVFIVARKPA